MNEDMLAAMTPQTLEGMQQVSRALTAKRKNKPGPGGIGAVLPSPRRMSGDKTNELDKIKEMLGMLGGGMQ